MSDLFLLLRDFGLLMLSIEFARLWVLVFLVLPLGLMFRVWVRRGHHVALPFDHGQQKRGRVLRFLTNCADMLPAMLLMVAVLIAAGPRRTGPPKDERVLNNILFCLDSSGSMGSPFGEGVNAEGFANTRYDGAMKAINEFANYREGDAFGLVVFGSAPLHWMPVTKDLSALSSAPPFLRPYKMGRWLGGGTLIGAALRSCIEELEENKEGDRAIILITDGNSSDLRNGQDRQVAEELREANVVTYVISMQQGIHPAMHTICSATGGAAFEAGDPAALKTIFKHIDEMQKSRIKQKAPLMLDFFTPFVWLGLALLGLKVLTMFGLRYTPW